MSYYDDDYNDYPRRKKQTYHNNMSYVFICAVGNNVIAHPLVLEKVNDYQQAITIHKTMFPTHQAMAVLRLTKLEAHFACVSFNRAKMSLSDASSLYMDMQPVIGTFTYGSATGMTPVYLSENTLCIAPVLNKQGSEKHIGYMVNSSYFNLILKMFGYEPTSRG